MKHDWIYQENDYRKCKNCFMEEWYVDDEGKWIYIGSEDFMNCLVSCEESSYLEQTTPFIPEIK